MDYKQHSIQDNKFERITPVSLDVSPLPVTQQQRVKHPAWLWPIAITLLVLAAAVFLWLPNQLQVQPSDSTALTALTNTINNTVDQTKQSSPWQEAQWAKQRKLSQQALGELLDKQSKLEKMAVEQWANQTYQHALTMAESGDKFYRNKDYQKASEYYQQGAQQMQAMLDKSDEVFRNTMLIAIKELQNNAAVAANQAFELALAIRPADPQAARGLYRAQHIDQILALKSEGTLLEQNKHLDKALALYQQALELDPDTAIVVDSIKSVTAKIKQRDFNAAMAAGYSALQHHQFDIANQQFTKASKLDSSPANKQEVLGALEETANQQTLYRIAQQREIAQQYQQQEKWQQASFAYKAILTIDSNLDFAKKGLSYSQQQLFLENQLLKTINQPQRLADDKVYQQALLLYKKAAATANTGPKLTQQRDTLAHLLKQAIIPVDVVFQSDNITDVTLYQIAHIGSFVHHTVSLKPGKYTVVGSRDGYRDVRQEFQVVLEQPLSPIVIQCREKVL